MRDVRVTWDLPTTRDSGRPLPIDEIAGVDVALSADGGANFTLLATVTPDGAQELEQQQLEPGDYLFRLIVIDTDGKTSSDDGVQVPFSIPDDSPPGEVTNVNVTVADAA